MGEKWPSMRGRKLHRIVRRLCGDPVRASGSHKTYRSPFNGQSVLVGFHDRDEVTGDIVRRILVSEIGLTAERARKEAR